MHTFVEAEERLNGHQSRRLVSNALFLVQIDADHIGVRLYDVMIVTYVRNGDIFINSGEFKITRTRRLINQYSGAGIDENWKLWDGTPFVDGMNVKGHQQIECDCCRVA